MRNLVLTHARFQRPPVRQKRRRGRLPGIVTWIPNGYDRLKPGARGELTFEVGDPDNGKRVRIVSVDLREDCPIHVEAINCSLNCEDGSPSSDLYVKPHNVRRVWTGLTENERIKLQLWRSS